MVVPSGPRYPAARRVAVAERIGGRVVADPYRWLEDADSAETQRWLSEQDRLLAGHLADWRLSGAFRSELEALTAADEFSAPVWRAGRAFYTRRTGDLVVLVVRADGERVLVDPSSAAPPIATLVAWTPSPAGTRVACQFVTARDEWLMRVLDSHSGEPVVDAVPLQRHAAVCWLGDDMLCHTAVAPEGGERVRARRLAGCGPAETDLLGPVLGPTTEFDLAASPSGRWLVAVGTDGLSNAGGGWVADLGGPPGVGGQPPRWRRLPDGIGAPTALAVSDDGVCYALSDLDAPRGRLLSVDLTADSPAVRTAVPEHADRVLDGFAVLDGGPPEAHCLLVVWGTGWRSVLTRHDLAGTGPGVDVTLPPLRVVEEITVAGGVGAAWVAGSGPATPPSVQRYDAATGVWTGWHVPTVPDLPPVRADLVRYPSVDGTPVELLVYRREDAPAGPLPTVLEAYGAFGHAQTMGYYAAALMWAARGGVFAVAGVRGGGEHGEDWHLAGTGAGKQRSVDDLLAAARQLCALGWSTPDTLGLFGQSAGGLLAAAALTQCPELFAAAACMSPLTDMARYELTGLGALWREEFGSRDEPGAIDWLLGYSPYHRAQGAGVRYPAVLLLASERDGNVDPSHARKFCAALQFGTTSDRSDRPVLLRMDDTDGHGQVFRAARIRRFAEALAFLAHHTGMERSLPGVRLTRPATVAE